MWLGCLKLTIVTSSKAQEKVTFVELHQQALEYFNRAYSYLIDKVVSVESIYSSEEVRPAQSNSNTWYTRKLVTLEIHHHTDADKLLILDRVKYKEDL